MFFYSNSFRDQNICPKSIDSIKVVLMKVLICNCIANYILVNLEKNAYLNGGNLAWKNFMNFAIFVQNSKIKFLFDPRKLGIVSKLASGKD